MRKLMLLACLIALSDVNGLAFAEETHLAPTFTANDASLIARNALLSAIVKEDPWLVRHILDLADTSSPRAFKTYPSPMSKGIDPNHNPDLARGARSAESSVEWIELLKQARQESDANKQNAQDPEEDTTHSMTARDAKGTMDWIKIIKEARDKKDGAAAK